jgi:hypothetical protein
MSWSLRRKLIIEVLLGAIVLGIIAVVLVATLYKTPSCMDGKQNQGEQGIDCGGPCPYECNADETAPTVRFARAVSPQPGRTDLIAYIDNSNPNAALQDAKYTAQFYGPNHTVVAQQSGVITVPPSTTYPLFIPDFYRSSQPVTQVFLTIDPSSYQWLHILNKSFVPIPSNIQFAITNTPKITATLMNTTAQPLSDVTVVATVFDSANNAIAASQTVVQELGPQSSAPIIFTWNEPFKGTPARVDILPAAPASI